MAFAWIWLVFLFLVVCSIAERNTVDLIDPLRNQIEWPNTVSVVWGPLRLKRRKKVNSGVLTWSEVCLAIATLMLLCSAGFRQRLLIFLWTFKGDRATKFATANTAANCQVVGRWQFSARSSQDVGVVSRMHKQNFATQPRDWPTTSEEAWRFDENLHATRRRSTAPYGQNEPLHLGSSSWMQMIRRFGRQVSVRTIRRRLLAAGYWSRRPSRCPRLTLEHRRRRREWGRMHRVWDLRKWRHCIFSYESWFSL